MGGTGVGVGVTGVGVGVCAQTEDVVSRETATTKRHTKRYDSSLLIHRCLKNIDAAITGLADISCSSESLPR